MVLESVGTEISPKTFQSQLPAWGQTTLQTCAPEMGMAKVQARGAGQNTKNRCLLKSLGVCLGGEGKGRSLRMPKRRRRLHRAAGRSWESGGED